MSQIIKILSLLLTFNVIFIYGYIPCNNWCPQSYGISCCDYYYSNPHPGYQVVTNPCQGSYQDLFCPIMDCTNTTSIFALCDSDDTCLRKEKCCKNPCAGGKKMCLIGVKQKMPLLGCPEIDNCQTWYNENRNPKKCTDTQECTRTEVCCQVPCSRDKVCQKSTQELYNPNFPFNCHSSNCY